MKHENRSAGDGLQTVILGLKGNSLFPSDLGDVVKLRSDAWSDFNRFETLKGVRPSSKLSR